MLKATGLRQSIDKETFGYIARYIHEQWREASSGGAPDEAAKAVVWEQAMLACNCLKENAGRLHDTALYQELKNLTFVPATKVGHVGVRC